MTKGTLPLLLVALLLLLVACTEQAIGTPTPTATANPTPTATQMPPTPTITPGVIIVTGTPWPTPSVPWPTPGGASQGQLFVTPPGARRQGVTPGSGVTVYGDEPLAQRMAGNPVSMYFDGRLVGNMDCSATVCMGKFTVSQDASPGEHTLEAGGMTITIMVVSIETLRQTPTPTLEPATIDITVEPASPAVGDEITVTATLTGAVVMVVSFELREIPYGRMMGRCIDVPPPGCSFVLAIESPNPVLFPLDGPWSRTAEWTLYATKAGEVEVAVEVKYFPPSAGTACMVSSEPVIIQIVE